MIRLIKMSIGADATADWPSAVHVNVLLKRNHHLVSLIAVHTMLHNALYCLFFFLIVEDAFLCAFGYEASDSVWHIFLLIICQRTLTIILLFELFKICVHKYKQYSILLLG